MSPQRHFRHEFCETVFVRTILASFLLLGLVAARGIPAQFVAVAADHSISADSHHEQRPRFDGSTWQWTPPAARFVLLPPVAKPFTPATVNDISWTLPSKGFHFNRPPPIA